MTGNVFSSGVLAQGGTLIKKIENVTGHTFSGEDLEEWKHRIDNNIYKNYGDVSGFPNSPGEHSEGISFANKFATNKPLTFKGPTTSNRNGNIPPGHPNGTSWNGSGQIFGWSDDPHFEYIDNLTADNDGRAMSYLPCAAFYGRVMGNDSIVQSVITRLVEQASEPLMDYTTTPRWLANSSNKSLFQHNPGFLMSEWLTGRAFAYDYVREFATPNQKSIIENWLRNGALWHKAITDQVFLYEGRYDSESDRDNFVMPTLSATDTGKYPYANYFTHDGGYVLTLHCTRYNNRSLATSGLCCTVIGAILNQDDLVQHGFNIYREYMAYGIFPDGTINDMMRGSDDGCGYGSAIISNLSTMAHTIWKTRGDNSWFEFTTSQGITATGEGSSTTGGSKNLSKIITTFQNYYNRTPDATLGFPRTHGNPVNGYNAGKKVMHFALGVSIANEYFQSTLFENFYKHRVSAGYSGWPSTNDLAASGYQDIMRGVYGAEFDMAMKYFSRGS